jgi:hypothetical protein
VKRISYFAAFGVAVVLLVLVSGCRNRGNPLAGTDRDPRPPDELLLERLGIAYGAMRDAEGAHKAEDVQRYTQVSVDAIAGPRGRHGNTSALPRGILPQDGAAVTDEPGLAMRAYEAAPQGSPLRAAITDGVIGDLTTWQTPSDRYDAIDRAVAAYPQDPNAPNALLSPSERALAWALVSLNEPDPAVARLLAGKGVPQIKQALDAVRRARSARG